MIEEIVVQLPWILLGDEADEQHAQSHAGRWIRNKNSATALLRNGQCRPLGLGHTSFKMNVGHNVQSWDLIRTNSIQHTLDVLIKDVYQL